MINLLPPSNAQRLRAARFNARLSRWLILGVVANIGLAIIAGAGWLYMDHQNQSLNKNLSSTKQLLQAQDLNGVQKKAQDINKNIKIINQVLGSEVRFSDLIQRIGVILPDGTVLKTLNLAKINGAIDLSVGALDYNSATQVAVNLSDPKNNLFSSVDIVDINCPPKPPSIYACTGTYKALFNTNAQKAFLNIATGGKQ